MKNYNYKSKTSFIVLKTDYSQEEEVKLQIPLLSQSHPREDQWWESVCVLLNRFLCAYTLIGGFFLKSGQRILFMCNRFYFYKVRAILHAQCCISLFFTELFLILCKYT